MPRIFDDITYKDTPVKYVGTDNTQFKALSEDASLQRNTADSAVFKALETNNALKVEDRNAPIKKAALDQLKQTLDQIKNNGTSMGAVSIINQATSDWTNNGALQEAIKSKKDEDLHIATIKKLYEDGDMSKENYEMNQVKTKEMNQTPLVYNTNTYTAENMFKGYRPTSDNKIKKEIYDKADLRQKDFLKSGVIFANGKTYKIDKTNGIGRVLVDGKEVTKQRVYEAIYQEVANEYIKLGYKLGIGGVLTFKNSNLKDVIKDIPLENIVLETDSPFLSPIRGSVNEPKNIKLIAECLSNIKNITISEVAKKTTDNVCKVFNIM